MAAFKNISEIKVGIKVRCLWQSYAGMTGTVVEVGKAKAYAYRVEWDTDDEKTFSTWFSYVGSNEPIGSCTTKVVTGAKCNKCNEYNEYADSDTYTCYSCRNK